MIGTTVSRYKILSELGGGGMGVAYEAEDAERGRNVAIAYERAHYRSQIWILDLQPRP